MPASPRRPRKRPQRRRRSEAKGRLDFLGHLQSILCSDASAPVMLREVARLASRSLCEYCVVDLVQGGVRRVEIAHADAGLFDLLRAEADAFVPRPGGRIERILRAPAPEVVPIVRSARALRGRAGARALGEALAELDFWGWFVPASFMTVPIEVRGQLAAVLTFAASRTPLRFDEARLAFACEIAAWCGLALEAAAARVTHEATPRSAFRSEPPTGVRRARELADAIAAQLGAAPARAPSK